MKPGNRIRQVLVCENPERPGIGIAAELRRFAAAQPLAVVTAGDKETAWGRLQSQPIAVAVIDVGRESGEAQALLRSIGRGFPSLPLFVFNGFMIPGIAEKAREYGHVHYCEDPAELPRFLSQILDNATENKKATLEGIRLTHFLDWLGTVKLNGRVTVNSGAKKGILYLQEGQLTGAKMVGTENDTALAEMSSWERVTVEVKEGGAPAAAARNRAASAPVAGRWLPNRLQVEPERNPRSRIETLRLAQPSKTLVIRIKKLQQTIAAIREMLPAALLRIDIFLSTDGRSLAAWNSQPLACSAFAGITRSLVASLSASRFPPLGHYYLFELEDEKLILIVISGEMQMGMMLARNALPMGLLTNIVLPRAIEALKEAHSVEIPT